MDISGDTQKVRKSMKSVFEKIIDKLEEIRVKKTCNKEKCDTKELCRICVVDDAIEIVKQEAEQYEECYKDCGECEAYEKEKHYCPKFCKVIKETVKEIEENHNGWIPCSEHQPEYGERVLLQDFGGNITLEKCERKKKVKGFTDGNWWSSANNYMAWQPLPQPYTNGE